MGDSLKTTFKIKVFFSKDLKEHIIKCGVCSECKKPNTGYAWCNKCDPINFSKSGNFEIDNLIYKSRLKIKHYIDNLDLIVYDRFKNVEPIREGGFAIIYSAIWIDGAPKFDKVKSRTGPTTVALKKPKKLKNFNAIAAFINEIKIHNECNYANPHITKLYGITKDPITEEYMMVLEFAVNGSLREYLKNHFSDLRWKEKLEILHNIIDNLKFIHDMDYIHKDLHSGNILQFHYDEWRDTKISDLGLAQSTKSIDSSESTNSNSSSIYGVLPYIAPEVLSGKQYTTASDVYSFGVIMVEVSTGKPPYADIPHNEFLAFAICAGLRPSVAKGTPRCYANLVNRCLNANPEERPSSEEILKIIRDWRFHDDHETHNHGTHKKSFFTFNSKKQVSYISMYKEFIDADIISPQETSLKRTLHPEAHYAGRIMSFTNLCEPVNSVGTQFEDSEDPHSQLIEVQSHNL